MPCDSTPRTLATLISLPGSCAPGSAVGTLMPGLTLGAPQTIVSGAAPTLTWHTVRRVGVGMLLDREHLAHHHLVERRRRRLDRLDLEAGHRQRVRQLARGERRVDEGAQPVFGELHASVTRSQACSAH